MFSAKPSLGFMLLSGSLVTAGIGAALGLAISYLQEAQLKRREIVSDFSTKTTAFTQRVTPEMMASLSLATPDGSESAPGSVPAEFRNLLQQLNYTLTEDPEARLTAYHRTGGEPPLQRIADITLGDFVAPEEDAYLNHLTTEVLSRNHVVIEGFPGDDTPLSGASTGVRSLLGTGNPQPLGAAFPIVVEGETFFIVIQSRVHPRILAFTRVMELRHFLPLIGIAPLFASLIFMGSWFTRRLQGLAQGMNTVTEGRFDYRLREAGPPEIEKVHASFNAMAESLRKTTDQFH